MIHEFPEGPWLLEILVWLVLHRRLHARLLSPDGRLFTAVPLGLLVWCLRLFPVAGDLAEIEGRSWRLRSLGRRSSAKGRKGSVSESRMLKSRWRW